MNLEIKIDDEFIKKELNIRSLSFTRSLDLVFSTAADLRRSKGSRFSTFILDNKLVGYNFAEKCGYKTPKVHQAGVPLSQISFLKNTVVKPMYENSSKGVFICHDNGDILYLNQTKKYKNEQEAKKYAAKLVREGVIRKDLWMVEELLTDNEGLAKDIKFYCFYGNVGLILETVRVPGIKRCWYDDDLNYVDTGKYIRNKFKGDRAGIDTLKNMAKTLSLEIPSPFVRIDFLVCNGSIYVGEFTPLPGRYKGFNNEWDVKLGELFVKASIEMAFDISIGKSFQNYISAEKTEKEVLKKINNNVGI